MRYSQYKYKFYINASHAIYIHGVLGTQHPHTWEIVLDTIKIRNDFVQFDELEKKANDFFSKYQDVNFNETEPFNTINPTLENITEFFMEQLKTMLSENGWLLSSIEVAETPSRSFIIDLSDDADELKNKLSRSDKDALDEKAEQKLNALFKE